MYNDADTKYKTTKIYETNRLFTLVTASEKVKIIIMKSVLLQFRIKTKNFDLFFGPSLKTSISAQKLSRGSIKLTI
jgi:hypothetical protein